jgi:hypothetical protein
MNLLEKKHSTLRYLYVDSEYIFLRLRTNLFEFVSFVPLLLLLPLPPTLLLTSPPLAGIGKAKGGGNVVVFAPAASANVDDVVVRRQGTAWSLP